MTTTPAMPTVSPAALAKASAVADAAARYPALCHLLTMFAALNSDAEQGKGRAPYTVLEVFEDYEPEDGCHVFCVAALHSKEDIMEDADDERLTPANSEVLAGAGYALSQADLGLLREVPSSVEECWRGLGEVCVCLTVEDLERQAAADAEVLSALERV